MKSLVARSTALAVSSCCLAALLVCVLPGMVRAAGADEKPTVTVTLKHHSNLLFKSTFPIDDITYRRLETGRRDVMDVMIKRARKDLMTKKRGYSQSSMVDGDDAELTVYSSVESVKIKKPGKRGRWTTVFEK